MYAHVNYLSVDSFSQRDKIEQPPVPTTIQYRSRSPLSRNGTEIDADEQYSNDDVYEVEDTTANALDIYYDSNHYNNVNSTRMNNCQLGNDPSDSNILPNSVNIQTVKISSAQTIVWKLLGERLLKLYSWDIIALKILWYLLKLVSITLFVF